MRYRRQYTVRGRTFKTVWRPLDSDTWAGITFSTREFAIDPILRTQPEDFQKEVLAHELYHMLYDSNDAPPHHPTRCRGHDRLAKDWVLIDRIMRTGTDGS